MFSTPGYKVCWFPPFPVRSPILILASIVQQWGLPGVTSLFNSLFSMRWLRPISERCLPLCKFKTGTNFRGMRFVPAETVILCGKPNPLEFLLPRPTAQANVSAFGSPSSKYSPFHASIIKPLKRINTLSRQLT